MRTGESAPAESESCLGCVAVANTVFFSLTISLSSLNTPTHADRLFHTPSAVYDNTQGAFHSILKKKPGVNAKFIAQTRI